MSTEIERIIRKKSLKQEMIKTFEDKCKNLTDDERIEMLQNNLGYIYSNKDDDFCNILEGKINVTSALKYVIEVTQIHNLFEFIEEHVTEFNNNDINSYILIERIDNDYYKIGNYKIKVIDNIGIIFKTLKINLISSDWYTGLKNCYEIYGESVIYYYRESEYCDFYEIISGDTSNYDNYYPDMYIPIKYEKKFPTDEIRLQIKEKMKKKKYNY